MVPVDVAARNGTEDDDYLVARASYGVSRCADTAPLTVCIGGHNRVPFRGNLLVRYWKHCFAQRREKEQAVLTFPAGSGIKNTVPDTSDVWDDADVTPSRERFAARQARL
jgi:hypothetical protein